MARLRFRATSLALGALCLFAACAPLLAAPPLPAGGSIARPQLTVGDTWVFQDPISKQQMTQSVIGELKGQFVMRDGSYSLGRALFAGGVVGMTIIGPVMFPYEGALVFPLVVGKTWKYTRTLNGRGEKITTRLDAKVAAWEGVRVSRGLMGAFRVDIVETQAPPITRSGVLYWTAWYAPDAKCVVKWELDSMPNVRTRGLELLDFTPGS